MNNNDYLEIIFDFLCTNFYLSLKTDNLFEEDGLGSKKLKVGGWESAGYKIEKGVVFDKIGVHHAKSFDCSES